MRPPARRLVPLGDVRDDFVDTNDASPISNDHVELYLDTFNDHRRSLLFAVNAFGIQSDGTFIEGSGIDRSPDFNFARFWAKIRH